jgi:penicillin-binding protein-related factor A (putative recombinase)
MRNQGTRIESLIEKINGGYLDAGIAKIEKVDAPCKVFGKKVIFLPNPFLDFTGIWRDGDKKIPLHIEVKSTKVPKLGIFHAGVSESQYSNLDVWNQWGAAAFVLWHHDDELRLVTVPMLQEKIHSDVKHIKWPEALVVPRGTGWIMFDFLKAFKLAMGNAKP